MNIYEIILDVCETQSISRTALKLNYTQSAISQAIKGFEGRLGFPLFKRSKHGVTLMPNTEDIIDSIRKICEEEHRISVTAANLTSLESGSIRIGAIQSVSYHWLPDILKAFSNDYPNIDFQLTVGGFSDLKKGLSENRFDCIFVSRYAAPELPFIPIGEDELLLVTPKGHSLSEHKQVSLDDVNEADYVLSSDGLDYETGNVFSQNHIHPNIKYRLNEDYATLKMVEAGFGITILPKLLLKDAPFDVSIIPFDKQYSRTLGVAYPATQVPSMATGKFLDYLQAIN